MDIKEELKISCDLAKKAKKEIKRLEKKKEDIQNSVLSKEAVSVGDFRKQEESLAEIDSQIDEMKDLIEKLSKTINSSSKISKKEQILNEISDVQVALDFLANAGDICAEYLTESNDSEFEYKCALKYISCARGELKTELFTLQSMAYGGDFEQAKNLRPSKHIELDKDAGVANGEE